MYRMSNPNMTQWMNDSGFTNYHEVEQYYARRVIDIVESLPDTSYIIWQDPIDNNVTVNGTNTTMSLLLQLIYDVEYPATIRLQLITQLITSWPDNDDIQMLWFCTPVLWRLYIHLEMSIFSLLFIIACKTAGPHHTWFGYICQNDYQLRSYHLIQLTFNPRDSGVFFDVWYHGVVIITLISYP